MLKVLLPSKNKQTGGYSSKHKAYDFDDIPDKNYYSSLFGKVVLSKKSETKSWRNTGKLTTNDYGNYIKIKGEVDGKTVFQLGAHFQPGTVLPKGKEVKRGDVVAQAGKTGNVRALHGGDGSHSHTEYRDGNEKNIPVVFVKNGEAEKKNEMEKLPKDSIIRDIYKSIRGDYPHDDEVARWLQENKNLQEIIDGVMRGDGKVKPRWLEIWKVEDKKDETSENFKETIDSIIEILRPLGVKQGDKTEVARGVLSDAVKELVVLREKKLPKPRIIIAEKEMVYIRWHELVIGVIKVKGGDKK